MRPDQKNPHETPRQQVNAAFGEIARAGLPADIDSATFADVLARLLSALRFINARDRGLEFSAAARAAGVSAPTAWRRKRALFDGGLRAFIPGSKGEPGISASAFNRPQDKFAHRETLGHVVVYLLELGKGLKPDQPAADLPISERKLHSLGERLIQHGIAGLAPDWRARLRRAREILHWKITPEHLDQVERLACECGSIRKAWKRFGRTPQCPARLSFFLRKTKRRLPRFLSSAISIKRIASCAFVGASGRIFVFVAGKKTFTIQKSRHVKNK